MTDYMHGNHGNVSLPPSREHPTPNQTCHQHDAHLGDHLSPHGGDERGLLGGGSPASEPDAEVVEGRSEDQEEDDIGISKPGKRDIKSTYTYNISPQGNNGA